MKAERGNATWWWAISLLATASAPFAHESGAVCAAIVAGIVTIQNWARLGRRCIVGIILGGLLNVGAVLLRSHMPGVGAMQWAGWSDLPQNVAFFLHGLVYPVAPVIGWLVHRWMWPDLTVVGITSVALVLLLIWLARVGRDWRWSASNLWWWALGALPAVASLSYGELYTSPRLHSLASAGVVMLWANVIIESGQALRAQWGRRIVWALLAGVIGLQNITFLHHQRNLFTLLNPVYQQVLEAAKDDNHAPLGFVNMPAWLAWRDQTYALISEGVMFVPTYSNVAEFIEVNLGARSADNVMFTPVIQSTDPFVRGFHGIGLDWEQMRQFAVVHRTVWLARYRDKRFTLQEVGAITAETSASSEALVQFTGGPMIESASVIKTERANWEVTLTWLASGSVDGEVFVHVRDSNNDIITQADGPALGGMVPIWLWQSGDRIRDVRQINLPNDKTTYTVQVGVYNAQGRLPALVDDERYPDDAAPIVTIVPEKGH
jgi:hypothetical protein